MWFQTLLVVASECEKGLRVMVSRGLSHPRVDNQLAVAVRLRADADNQLAVGGLKATKTPFWWFQSVKKGCE